MKINWTRFNEEYPKEGEPVLCLFDGNDVCDKLIMQCSLFEGRMYPDHLDGLIDYDDAVNPLKWARVEV